MHATQLAVCRTYHNQLLSICCLNVYTIQVDDKIKLVTPIGDFIYSDVYNAFIPTSPMCPIQSLPSDGWMPGQTTEEDCERMLAEHLQNSKLQPSLSLSYLVP